MTGRSRNIGCSLNVTSTQLGKDIISLFLAANSALQPTYLAGLIFIFAGLKSCVYFQLPCNDINIKAAPFEIMPLPKMVILS
jgi:hypothetical protein